MSVCVAAICSSGDSEYRDRIVAICDRKVSGGSFSNEDAALKGQWFCSDWLALFAGNDISPCIPILNEVQSDLAGMEERTLKQVTKAFERRYQEHLSNVAASQVLGRWQLGMDKFLEHGRKKFGADVFDNLCAQIERVKLECRFLVCGFSGGEGHLFTVRNPGVIEVHDNPGYYAIGNGGLAAMSTLSFFTQSTITFLDRTLYNVLCAKFMAESASDVGEQSFVWLISPRKGPSGLNFDIYTEIRNAWEKEGKPKVPEGILDRITSLLASNK